MDPVNYLYIGLFCFFSSAVISLLPFRKIRVLLYMLSAVGVAGFATAALYLCFSSPGDGGAVITSLKFPFGSLCELEFRGDALSGFFTFIISLLSFSVSLYAIGYTNTPRDKRSAGFLFNLFILSMFGVVLSANIITFLLSWEAMSVISYLLVNFDNDKRPARARLIYAVMVHIGTALIIALFLVLYQYSGSMDFREIRAASAALPGGMESLVFIFSLLGFGTMAGIIPLHAWLLPACSAAPSHFASLIAGVMLKIGIFGFLRVSMDIVGQRPEWAGITVLMIGALSSVVGSFYALKENDIKRLLAYSCVGSTGIILLGTGASMMFRDNSQYGLSAVALSAGLYHILNHSLFNGLLFLSAGSAGQAAPKNMDDQGRLLNAIPHTGIFFLIGSLSLCALPPFNGFVSVWLLYHSLIQGIQIPSFPAKIIFTLGLGALALSIAFSAAAFVKAFRTTFPGRINNGHEGWGNKPSFFMGAGMAFLACLCIMGGLIPDTVMALFSSSIFILTGSTGILGSGGTIHISQAGASLSPAAILAAITIASTAALTASILIAKWKKK